jgi:uncharacterized protein (DUF433 family)
MTKEIPVPGYNHLVTKEGRCGGRVTVKGHRIEPHNVVLWFQHLPKGEPQILIPDLTEEVYTECLRYCMENSNE